MKKLFPTLLLSIVAAATLHAGDICYIDGTELKLIGRGIPREVIDNPYRRIPDSLQNIVPRWQLWNLGGNTSGMALRFSSDSPTIKVRWRNTGKVEMNHMTATCIRGLDLYALQPDSTWRFVNSARPDLDSIFTETTVISNMTPGVMRDFMLYLPLYDGIDQLAVGIDSDYSIAGPLTDLPSTDNPVVAYGTSILQGGCASRPGMSHINQLSRRLNREIINFGFSGNGQLDLEIAPVIASVRNPSLFVLDFCPNVNMALIEEKMIPFFRIIRDQNPDVPVLFIENPVFPHSEFDNDISDKIRTRNATLRHKYEELVASGEKNIYYLEGEEIIGHDGEGTVDGIHFTDLGFYRYTNLLYPVVDAILNTK